MKRNIDSVLPFVRNKLNKPYAPKLETKSRFSIPLALAIGGVFLPLSAFNYFQAFYSSFGISDYNTSDVVRVMYRLASGGHFLLGFTLVMFWVAIIPIVSFHFYSVVIERKAITNKVVLWITLILGLATGLFWIYFIKNELVWPNASDLGILFFIEFIVLITIFVRSELIYSLFFFLPFAFSQRGAVDAHLVVEKPAKFTIEYKDKDSLKTLVFDGVKNIYIDQSESILYYKEVASSKVKKIEVINVVSTLTSNIN